MGQYILITGLASAVVVFVSVASSSSEKEEQAYTSAYVSTDVSEPAELPASNGSALATAAFGMSALQPETYNRDVVVDIIHASPLSKSDKSRLTGYLQNAETGTEKLSVVLKNVRIALAVN